MRTLQVELDPSSSSQSDSHKAAAEVISAGIKKLEKAIHRIVVHCSVPDWLLFLPNGQGWSDSTYDTDYFTLWWRGEVVIGGVALTDGLVPAVEERTSCASKSNTGGKRCDCISYSGVIIILVGKVSRYHVGSGQILLITFSEYPVVSKTLDDVESTQPDNSLYKEDGSVEIDFYSLIDVHKVKGGTSGPRNVAPSWKTVVPSQENKEAIDESSGVSASGQFTETLNTNKEQLSEENSWDNSAKTVHSTWMCYNHITKIIGARMPRRGNDSVIAVVKLGVDATAVDDAADDPDIAFPDESPFYDQIKDKLQLDFNKNPIVKKLRRLKKKYRNIISKSGSGKYHDFKSPHDQATFEISCKIWDDIAGVNGTTIRAVHMDEARFDDNDHNNPNFVGNQSSNLNNPNDFDGNSKTLRSMKRNRAGVVKVEEK
ncbi:DNA-binding storekeeper protein-relatedtranscriptional regulator [Forsythia ovata]|uniref:DNA-binding storekeeper protein-relatedtranscriptional regulator n=1 Tax=Forsythia ovata TaxID=205694 RepID=A0ABD1SNW7_9LAMI